MAITSVMKRLNPCLQVAHSILLWAVVLLLASLTAAQQINGSNSVVKGSTPTINAGAYYCRGGWALHVGDQCWCYSRPAALAGSNFKNGLETFSSISISIMMGYKQQRQKQQQAAAAAAVAALSQQQPRWPYQERNSTVHENYQLLMGLSPHVGP